jgi:hypothetical protein
MDPRHDVIDDTNKEGCISLVFGEYLRGLVDEGVSLIVVLFNVAFDLVDVGLGDEGV